MVWPKCLTKVFRRDRTSTRPRIHRRQAEGLQHTGPVIAAGHRLRHFCVCRPFAVQGAVTKYARSTATAASLAVYPDGPDIRCRSCRNPTGIYVRVCGRDGVDEQPEGVSLVGGGERGHYLPNVRWRGTAKTAKRYLEGLFAVFAVRPLTLMPAK